MTFNPDKTLYKTSRITKKITGRIILIESVCFILIIALAILIIWPQLLEDSLNKASDRHLELTSQISDSLTDMKEVQNMFLSSNDLKNMLDQYSASNHDPRIYSQIGLALEQYTSISKLRAISIELEGGPRFISVTKITSEDLSIFDSEWYQNIERTKYLSGYSNLYIAELETGQYPSIAFCRNYYDRGKYFTISTFTNVSPLIRSIDSITKDSFSGTAVFDKNGDFLFGSESDEPNISDVSAMIKNEGVESVTKTNNCHYFTRTIDSNGWIVASYISNRDLYRELYPVFLLIIPLICLLYLGTLFLVTSRIRSVMKPLYTLSKTMSSIKDGKMTKSQIDSKDEIEDLANIYNGMLDTIQTGTNQLLEKEKYEQLMQYNLLISQIDPHFICNTISSINSLARMNRNEDIVNINSALISILQDRLRVNGIEIFDSIEQEIEIVKQYLQIQSYRYDYNVNVIWEIEEVSSKQQIPKNIIQPLVENALIHGLIDEKTGSIEGELRISITQKDAFIEIHVIDNGRGIAPDYLEQLTRAPEKTQTDAVDRGKHIGIRNIQGRLKYIYGDMTCLFIHSSLGEGTDILIRLTNDAN
ncbi:hypothetical protein AGMMS49983_04370 [Clostridia bacterium]|nr:hypothetical protein AGMMS49983_04370 [Clostridia bacterium]